MIMNIHKIEARDLPDLWFQAVHDILDHGNRFVIDRGSYAGQTRLEYDFFIGDDTDINLALREGIKRIRNVVDDVDAERPELIISSAYASPWL